MWLMQRKLGGADPPAALTTVMVPPSTRQSKLVPAAPQYNNPELQAVADEIERINADKLQLEADMQQKEATIRCKNTELKNLSTEHDTLNATCNQLNHQKDMAQKKLDDLAAQNKSQLQQIEDLQALVEAELHEV